MDKSTSPPEQPTDVEREAELARIAEAFPPKPKCDADGKFRPGETLEEYFARNGTPADPAVIAEYERSMREVTIPAIERDMRANARAAHYLRLGIPDPALPTPQGDIAMLVEALERRIRPNDKGEYIRGWNCGMEEAIDLLNSIKEPRR